ncbi:MAG: hypothetical protein R3C14_21690 [Caldilineaceae bacterium]
MNISTPVRFTSSDFSVHLNQPFTLELETLPPILLQLRAVHNLENEDYGLLARQSQRFAVVFHGPLRPILPKQIYRVKHPTMGRIDLLFVPIGPNGSAMQYKATLA